MIKEEGECNEVTHLDLNEGPEQKLVGIDMSRIVAYPGFNAPSKFYLWKRQTVVTYYPLDVFKNDVLELI